MLRPFDFFPPHYMPPETPLDHVADVLLVLGCVLIVLFTIIYGSFFRWWLTRAGRAVFFVFVSMSLLMGLITAAHVSGGDYVFRDLLRVVVYVLLPVSMSYMFYALLRNFIHGPTQIVIESRSSGRPDLHEARKRAFDIGEPDVGEDLPDAPVSAS